jgi:hypothetical protein
VKFGAIWNGKGVIVADLVGFDPVWDFVFVVFLDIAIELALVPAVDSWPVRDC